MPSEARLEIFLDFQSAMEIILHEKLNKCMGKSMIILIIDKISVSSVLINFSVSVSDTNFSQCRVPDS